MKAAIFGVAIALTVSASAPARAETAKKTLVLTSDDTQKVATLAVSECGDGEESTECVSHHLQCVKGGSLSLYAAGGDDAKAMMKRVSDLVTKEVGTASMTALLAGGKSKVSLSVLSFEITSNEMNGTWDLTAEAYSVEPFFDALTEKTAPDMAISLGGQKYVFYFKPVDTAKIVDFKRICVGYRK